MRVFVSFTCVLLLEAQQEQTSKLRIFMIKLSHSSSTYENTFAFQHFSDRLRAITFGLKERAILFAYTVRTVLGTVGGKKKFPVRSVQRAPV